MAAGLRAHHGTQHPDDRRLPPLTGEMLTTVLTRRSAAATWVFTVGWGTVDRVLGTRSTRGPLSGVHLGGDRVLNTLAH